jgi:hypothetical protein
VDCGSVVSDVCFEQYKKNLDVLVMNRGGGNHLSGLTPETGGSDLTIPEAFAEHKTATSELYFVACTRQSIDAADISRFATTDVTLIYLSFTNGDISIALPGCGVTLEGGATGT